MQKTEMCDVSKVIPTSSCTGQVTSSTCSQAPTAPEAEHRDTRVPYHCSPFPCAPVVRANGWPHGFCSPHYPEMWLEVEKNTT